MATVTKEFRVSLNPRNPEANSWYDPGTRTNLFLSTPQSDDLSRFSVKELDAVACGIRAGLLIVSKGDPPDGLRLESIKNFSAPRFRWSHEDPTKQDQVDAQARNALNNHDRVVNK